MLLAIREDFFFLILSKSKIQNKNGKLSKET